MQHLFLDFQSYHHPEFGNRYQQGSQLKQRSPITPWYLIRRMHQTYSLEGNLLRNKAARRGIRSSVECVHPLCIYRCNKNNICRRNHCICIHGCKKYWTTQAVRRNFLQSFLDIYSYASIPYFTKCYIRLDEVQCRRTTLVHARLPSALVPND